MSWLTRMWRGRNEGALAQRRDAEPDELKDYTIVVQVGADGFVPAVQFGGDDLGKLLEAATWSYACITSNAEALASLPGQVQRAGEEGEDEWVRDRAHPLNKLLRAPNGPSPAPPNWSWQQLLETIGLHLYLTGNAYLRPVLVDSGRRVHRLDLLNPTRVEPIEDAVTGLPKEYLVGNEKVKPERLVHIMNAAPGSMSRGQSPLQAALRAVEVDATAAERQKANLRNKIAPGMILSVEGAWNVLDKTQRDKIQEYFTANYAKATQDGRPLVIGKNAKLISPPNTNQQLDYFDTRRFSRDEMLAVFHVPPPVVGIYENATLQNFATALRIWWMVALFPMLETIYSALNRQLVAPVYGDDVRLWYNLTGSEIALLLLKERILVAKELVGIGYPTNMAAAHVGLGMPYVEELDQANTHLVAAGRLADSLEN